MVKSQPECEIAEGQVPNDVMHLITLANFNGLCRVIAALAQNGDLAPFQLTNIEDCMTAPLDDPDWRDNSSMAETRDVLEAVLARAMMEASGQWSLKADPGSSPG